MFSNPSPNFQSKSVGSPVELSVKLTRNGKTPVVVVFVKFADSGLYAVMKPTAQTYGFDSEFLKN